MLTALATPCKSHITVLDTRCQEAGKKVDKKKSKVKEGDGV